MLLRWRSDWLIGKTKDNGVCASHSWSIVEPLCMINASPRRVNRGEVRAIMKRLRKTQSSCFQVSITLIQWPCMGFLPGETTVKNTAFSCWIPAHMGDMGAWKAFVPANISGTPCDWFQRDRKKWHLKIASRCYELQVHLFQHRARSGNFWKVLGTLPR